MKVRGKLIAAFLAVGLLPALVIATLSWRSLNHMTIVIQERYAGIAFDVVDKIERNLFERYGDVQAFGLNTVLHDRAAWYARGEDNAIVAAMNEYVAVYGIYSITLAVDLEGKVIAVNSRDAAGKPVDTGFIYDQNFASAPWFQDAVAGRFTASSELTGTVVEDLHVDPLVKRISGDEGLTIGYTAPFRDASGKVAGVWKNFAKWELVEDIVAAAYDHLKSDGLPTASITLLDRRGRIIVDCDPSRTGATIRRDMGVLLNSNLSEAGVEAARLAIDGKSGHTRGRDPRTNEWQSTGYARSAGALGYPGVGWSALVRVPERDSLAMINALRTQTAATIALSCAAVGAFAWFFAGVLVRPIRLVVDRVREISSGDGDLTRRLELNRKDELGDLASAFNAFLDNLHGLIAKVRDAAVGVASSATEIAASSEEMASSMAQVADRSAQASSHAEDSGKRAAEGGSIVVRTVEGMRAIEQTVTSGSSAVEALGQRSEEIGRVIAVINDIADQTNLLALNAAIEAARAGEHGRGFAVVADEVRKLADRTTKATEEIAGSIKEIQSQTKEAVDRMNVGSTQVKDGVQQALQAGESLNQIVASAQGVAEMISSIHAVTAEAREAVDQAATATGDLSAKAEEMQALVGRFKL